MKGTIKAKSGKAGKVRKCNTQIREKERKRWKTAVAAVVYKCQGKLTFFYQLLSGDVAGGYGGLKMLWLVDESEES